MSKMIIVEGNSNDKDNVRTIMVKGERGYSAYEIAVQNGYEGTEEEWKDSFLNAETYYNKTETDNLLDEKTCRYDTVALMKADTDLKDGMVAETLGYYATNDGGGSTYLVTNEESETEYQEELENGLYATLISNVVNVNQFGAYGDGIHDDSIAIQNYFSYCKFSDDINFVNGCSYYITTPLYIPSECSINFNWATFILDAGLNDFAIYYGYNLDGTRVGNNRLRTYANNFYVTTSDNEFHENCNFLKVGREATISHFDSRYVDCVIEWPEDYIDFSVVKYGYISSRDNSSNYAISILQQGDLCEISHIQQGAFQGTVGNDNTIYIAQNHYNVLIKDIIGSIDCYSPATIENIMLTYYYHINQYGGNATIKHIRGSLNKLSANRLNIYDYISSSSPNYVSNVTIEDVIFSYSGAEVTDLSASNPIYIDNFDTLMIKNCFVSCFRSNGNNFISKAYAHIKMGNTLSDIETYINKFIIQYNGVEISKYNYKRPIYISKAASESFGITSISTTGQALFNGNSATYYYDIQRIHDESIGACSKVSSEVSVAATNGESSPLLKLSSNKEGRYIIRRGTTTGVYTHYAIISLPTSTIIDNGITVNGIAWIEGTYSTSIVSSSMVCEYFNNKKIISPAGINSFDNYSFDNGDIYIKTNTTAPSMFVYIGEWKQITLS